MSLRNVVPTRQLIRAQWPLRACALTALIRRTGTSSPTIKERPKIDGRNRLSAIWSPTSIVNKQDASNQDMLVRGAIMRQAHTGIFHLLPLGLRVQDKIEKLIDKHMTRLGASKVSLSSITSDKLWQQSGRGRNDEFFRMQDRKGAKYLLSPTHEEEITALVAADVSSYKELPLRLYQVTRKYRDEARPRQGLLRAREFLMKDLYTFDATEQEAKQTYDEVRQVYAAFFADLGVPVIEAGASSGNMGGNLSHEYHFMAKSGEDTVITCTNCDFASNEEVFRAAAEDSTPAEEQAVTEIYGISKDRSKLYKILTPRDQPMVNMHLVKTLLPDLDVGIEDALSLWTKTQGSEKLDATFILADARLAAAYTGSNVIDNQGLMLTQPRIGDQCPNCHRPTLQVGQAVELGHTFHLGTRYSEPFNAVVHDSSGKNQTPMQMGCHGIGMSRIMAAVSSSLADDTGLNWPLSIAPFSALVTAVPAVAASGAVEEVHDLLQQEASHPDQRFDAVIDDRQKSLGYKLNDADLVGYPFIVVLGRKFASEGKVEVQCRRLGVKEDVVLAELVGFIKSCTNKLKAM